MGVLRLLQIGLVGNAVAFSNSTTSAAPLAVLRLLQIGLVGNL